MFPATKGKYSYNWALGVAYDLARKYPRATDFMWKALDISIREAANFLAHSDPVWAQIRECVHILNSWAYRTGRDQSYLIFEKNYYTSVKSLIDVISRKGWIRLAGRLKDVQKKGML